MNTATISGNDFLDILFNGRNKDYGAYELRRKYDRRVRNAIMGTASMALLAVGSYALSNHLSVTETHTLSRPVVDVVKLRDLSTETKTPPPPALPSSTPPPARPSVKFLPPVIARNEEVRPEDVPPRIEELENKSVGVTTTDGDVHGIDVGLVPDAPGTGVVDMPLVKEREDPDHVFRFVEIPPSFPGGEEALAKYLGNNTRYPHVAAENGIEGVVVVQFVVDYEGNVKDVKVVTPAKGGGLEQEASRVIRSMPKWKPGRQNGRYVSVLYSIPVNFRLNQ